MNETTNETATTDSGFRMIVDSPIESNFPAVDHEAKADRETLNRVDLSLDELDQLSDLLGVEGDYEVDPLDFELPADFKLSVIIPVYNEQATIYKILDRVNSLPLPKEIIVVDDRSTDGTRRMLNRLEACSDDLRIIYKPQNEGKGAALRTGFEQATGDIVVVQDADLEYDPRDIPPLLKPIIDDEADIVYGSRFLGDEPQDPSWIHRLGNGTLTAASNLFTRLRLTDMETCYKAFRRDVIQSVEIKQNRFGFEPEVTAKLARRKHRFVERPITYDARGYDEGKKIGVKDLFNALYCIVRYGVAD